MAISLLGNIKEFSEHQHDFEKREKLQLYEMWGRSWKAMDKRYY